MKIHSNEKINRIKELRQLGYSINEIVLELKIAKTTVWHHIKGVEVKDNFKSQLKSKRGGRALKFDRETREAEVLASEILLTQNSKLAIAAAMLYWGEGGKKVCDLTNTDPKLIQLYLKFLKDVLSLHNDNVKFIVRVFTGMQIDQCLRYWAKNLDIDAKNIVVRYNDGGVRGKSPFGIFRIIPKKGSKVLKLMHALIRLIYSDLMELGDIMPQWIENKRINKKNISP